MFSLTKSTVAIGLLAVILAPLPALAHDRDDDNYSNVRVIRYDPNSHGDIYEDSNDGKYHANGRFGGRHHHKKKKKKHYGRFGRGNYEYHNNGRFGGNQPQSQPQTNNGRFGGNQPQQNCTTSRFGTVCR